MKRSGNRTGRCTDLLHKDINGKGRLKLLIKVDICSKWRWVMRSPNVDTLVRGHGPQRVQIDRCDDSSEVIETGQTRPIYENKI